MVAALTPLPVIGVPVRASTLDGLDSLMSIVQVKFLICLALDLYEFNMLPKLVLHT